MNLQNILRSILLKYNQFILKDKLKHVNWNTSFETQMEVGLCVFLHPKHINYFIASANSLFTQLGYSLPIYIVDDGLLKQKEIELLKKHFYIIYHDVNRRNKKFIKLFHRYKSLCRFRLDPKAPQFRFQYDAYLLHPFQRIIFLDSDVLFYKKPLEIDRWIKSKEHRFYYSICNDYLSTISDPEENELVIRKLLLEKFNSKTHPLFSNSLLLLPGKNKKFIHSLNQIHQLMYSVGYSHKYLSAETALCVAFGRMNANLLNPDLYINIWLNEQYKILSKNNIISLHYAYETKRKFARDSLILLKSIF